MLLFLPIMLLSNSFKNIAFTFIHCAYKFSNVNDTK